MASVTSTSVNKTRELQNGNFDYQYRFDLLDNLNNNHVEYHWSRDKPSDWDTDAEMTAMAPVIIRQKSDVEFAQIRTQISLGQNPFYSGAAQVTFLWDTWNTYFVRACESYWSVKDLTEILNFEIVWTSAVQGIGTNAIKILLGIGQQVLSDLNADMQNAVNIRNMKNAYTPHYSDGVWS